MSDITEQFDKHEQEDQRRFEEQGRNTKTLFKEMSNLIGEVGEKAKKDRELHKNIMEDLKEAKEDINILKVDVKEVKTDIKWLRENAEKENKQNENDIDGLVSMDRFSPVEKIVYGFTAITVTAIIGGVIGVIVWLIQNHFSH